MDVYTIADELYYTASHLWVSVEGEQATIGLTQPGAELYGRILYVGLPAVEAPVVFGMPIGYLQSAGFGLTQLFPPVQGRIVEINDELWRRPTLINEDPLEDGWIAVIAMSHPAELENLESARDYRALLRAGATIGHYALPRHLQDSAQPAFLIDERRRVLTCNAAAEKLIGLSADALRHGPLCAELFGCHTAAHGPIGKHDCPGMCAMMNLEPLLDQQYQITNARGEEISVAATYTPVTAPGQPRQALVVLQTTVD